MKKFLLPVLFIASIIGCSSDDDTTVIITPEPDVETGQAIIRISEVRATNDEVVLTNQGTATLDVGDYFLCLGPGTYAQVSGLTTTSTTLAAGASVTLSYDVNPISNGLAVFSTDSFSSSDPDVLIDYVQWGAANQARVDQAVTAGRWDNASNFVTEGSPYTFTGAATDVGSTFWEGTTLNGIVRILTVDTTTDQVTLTNLGNGNLDAGSYFLCLGPGTYQQVANLTSESTMIAPNQTLTVTYDVNPTSNGLGVFAVNSFGSSDPDVLLDYVQWGAANQARVDQAVTAGRWDDASNFVTGESPYNYTGGSQDVGVTFWE